MKGMRNIALVLVLPALFTPLRGERINTVSATVSAVAAEDDNPQVTGVRLAELSSDYLFTWGLYPSLQLVSKGARSQFDLNYAFGLNRVDSDLDFDSESHSVGLGWQIDTNRWSVRLQERFRKSPDFTTFNLFQGIVFTPEGVFFDYDTVALRRDSFENTSSLQIDRRLGARSSLTFGIGHSIRDYDQDPRFRRRLSDQSQVTGNVGWDRELSSQATLNTRYEFTHFNFETGVYPDGRSHDLSLGISYQVNPTVRLSLSGGPSYTEQLGTGLDHLGYNAGASVSKTFEEQFISFFYDRRNGASVGIGSLSRTQRLGFGFTQFLGRRLSADFGLSLFETQRILNNPVDLRGLQASLILNVHVSRNWLLNVGASYNSQEENSDLEEIQPTGRSEFDRRRIWVSIRFALPEFWRF